MRVEDPADLDAAVREVLDHPGPALLDAVTATQELSMPPHIAAKEAVGFSLYTLRALLDGRGAELVELAKTNLLR